MSLRKIRSTRDSLKAMTAALAHANCVLQIILPIYDAMFGSEDSAEASHRLLCPDHRRFIDESNRPPTSAQAITRCYFYGNRLIQEGGCDTKSDVIFRMARLFQYDRFAKRHFLRCTIAHARLESTYSKQLGRLLQPVSRWRTSACDEAAR
jgi:hypothetical protein